MSKASRAIRFLAGVALCFSVVAANAALIDRGDGFIYDDVLDITWAQNADVNGNDTWYRQTAWVNGYSQTHSVYGSFDDWRLPSMDVNDDNVFIECAVATEAECRDNELGYMFYHNDITVGSSGPFINFQNFYWSGTPVSQDVWTFVFYNSHPPGSSGYQYWGFPGDGSYAWAVRDGDVIPVPPAIWLMTSGLLALFGFRKRNS